MLAEQLSQDPNVKVVLLEAGPDGIDADVIKVPAYAGFITALVTDQYVWNFTSQPDPNLGGLNPPLNQGHVLGGGSVVNYLAYCRGAPFVFDEWAEISGDEELRWDALLEDFRATSHYADAPSDYEQLVNTSAYGNGPLEVSHSASLGGFDPPFFHALKAGLSLSEV